MELSKIVWDATTLRGRSDIFCLWILLLTRNWLCTIADFMYQNSQVIDTTKVY